MGLAGTQEVGPYDAERECLVLIIERKGSVEGKWNCLVGQPGCHMGLASTVWHLLSLVAPVKNGTTIIL